MNDDGKMKEYKSFDEFYPFYLSQHQNIMSQRLHFIGTALACLFFLFFLFHRTFDLVTAHDYCGLWTCLDRTFCL